MAPVHVRPKRPRHLAGHARRNGKKNQSGALAELGIVARERYAGGERALGGGCGRSERSREKRGGLCPPREKQRGAARARGRGGPSFPPRPPPPNPSPPPRHARPFSALP